MKDMTSPFSPSFSIIIPTYNRAHLLPFAVKSVLQQTFEDFEIVISNGGSTDNTREVVAEFDDPRIAYIESDRRLSIAENYQAGLEHASGEFITFLSDDDAYVPSLLHSVNETFEKVDADIVGYKFCRYYHTDIHDLGRTIKGNSLIISPSSGSITKFSSEEALKLVLSHFGLGFTPSRPNFVCPYLSNATYKRTIFDSLCKKRANLFDMVPADMYLAAAVFFEVEHYHCLDEELLVWSNWDGNSTASIERQRENLRKHYEALTLGKELSHTPLKIPIAPNCAANALLEALTEYGADESLVDWAAYFVTMRQYLSYLKSEGLDVSDDEDALGAMLQEQSEDVQVRVARSAFHPKTFVKDIMFDWVPGVAKWSRARIARARSRKDTIVSGSQNGFSNVFEASRFVR